MKIFATLLLSPFITIDIYTTYCGLYYFFRKGENQVLAHSVCIFFSLVFTGLLYYCPNLLYKRERNCLQKYFLGVMAIIWSASFLASMFGLIKISGNNLSFSLEKFIAWLVLLFLAIFCSSASVFLRVIHETCSGKTVESD